MATANVAELYGRLIAKRPLVQNITNTVVQQFTANVLLAMGASPAMVDHEADAGHFASIADALLVNFGTASNQQLMAADAAITAAKAAGKPWVLDPVSVGVLPSRTTRIRQALAQRPTVVRGNASEIASLAGFGQGGRGVDSTDEVDAVLRAAVHLARSTGSIVAISGARDAIVEVGDAVRIARVRGGHPLMAKVVGTGCSLGSAVAAYLGAQRVPEGAPLASDLDATIAAHVHFALAGKIAGRKASAPGSFAVAFIDALSTLSAADWGCAEVDVETRSLADFETTTP